MKSIKSIFKVLTMCLILTSACKTDGDYSDNNTLNTSPNYLSEYLGEKKSKDFTGYILDENKTPLEGAIVTVGNKTSITDTNGNFIIKNAIVNVHFASLETKKHGYKNNTRSIIPSDSIISVKIQLQKESDLCLHWFCKHNHSLPDPNN